MTKPWFRRTEELVDQLRRSQSTEVPLPEVAGYQDFLRLAGGGQGTVFLATRDKDARRVALKVFHTQSFDSPLARRRFEREISLVSRLAHPNVVRLLQYGNTRDGRPFLAMEFISGLPLDEWAEGKSVREVVALIRQLSAALDHAHRRGVIHRDLKPGNVRVDEDGNSHLLDFGLAKPVGAAAQGGDLSSTGEFLGSLKWASPEQVAGHPDQVDTRTDVYALGLLLHYCLTQSFPYDTDGGVGDIVERIRRTAPEPLGQKLGSVHADLETIVLRCLAKNPDRRYGTVADLARDLDHFLSGDPIEARRDSARFILTSLVRRHSIASAAIGLALLALISFAIITSGLLSRARIAERTAVDALADKREEAEKVAAVNEFLISSFVGPSASAESVLDVPLSSVLDAAANRVETDAALRAQPQVRADLHVAFAYWFASSPGRFQNAIEHAGLALHLYAEGGVLASSQLAWASEVRGTVRMRSGDFDRARSDLSDALAVYRAADADELNAMRVQLMHSSCAFALDDLDGIESTLLECREIASRRLGAAHPQTRVLDDFLAVLRERLARG